MANKKTWNFSDAPRVSRQQARLEGLKQYFDGYKCSRGHVSPRYVAHGNCVVCSAEDSLAWQRRAYLNDADGYRAHRRLTRRKDPIGALLRVAKSRAKKKGLEFSISASDLPMLKMCPCCGVEMCMRDGVAKPGPTPQSPSIDRFDSNRGYVPGNVAIICWRCNELKRDASADELRNILVWMERRSKPRLALISQGE